MVCKADSLKIDPPCEMCKGLGAVPTAVCRGCGKPAWKRVEGIEFCGEDKCLDSLVRERTHRFGTYSSTSRVVVGPSGIYRKNGRTGDWERNMHMWDGYGMD